MTTFSNEEPASYWKATADIPSFPALTEDTECDVAVIGGGITSTDNGIRTDEKEVSVSLSLKQTGF